MKPFLIIGALLVSAITMVPLAAFAADQEETYQMNLDDNPVVANFVGAHSVTLTKTDLFVYEALKGAIVQICREKDIRRSEMVFACIEYEMQKDGPHWPRDSVKHRWLMISVYAAVKADMEKRGLKMYSKPIVEGEIFGAK